jgi:hypothetical protein
MHPRAYAFAPALCLALQASAQQDVAPRWKGWCDLNYPPGSDWPARLNLPEWVCETAYHLKLHDRYAPDTSINPFFLSGDFNNDGRSDAAIWVTQKKDGKRGIVILHQGNRRPTVIGAGVNFRDRGDDYAGLDVWSLIPKGKVLNSSWEDHRKVALRGDALVIGKSESSSVAIYWDGKRYAFYQLTD